MGTVGPPRAGVEEGGGGGLKSIFRKNSFLSVSRRNSFLMFHEVIQGSKRDSVNLTFNAFFHSNFSSRYIMVPGGGPTEVV